MPRSGVDWRFWSSTRSSWVNESPHREATSRQYFRGFRQALTGERTMAKKIPLSLPDHGQFPPLLWDDYVWSGVCKLRSWRGFQRRTGDYGAADTQKTSTGLVSISIGTRVAAKRSLPTREQSAAFQFLIERDKVLRDLILAEVFRAYPALQTQYGYDTGSGRKIMPTIKKPTDLKRLIGLATVHILPVQLEGTAYTGFEFGCTWDVEHGLGVMTHRQRIVEVGGAESAFLEWIAQDDARQQKKVKQPKKS
jgi:hypothetical protein